MVEGLDLLDGFFVGEIFGNALEGALVAVDFNLNELFFVLELVDVLQNVLSLLDFVLPFLTPFHHIDFLR